MRVRKSIAMTVAIGLAATALSGAARAACCYFAAKEKDIDQPGQKAFINWNPSQKLEAFTVQPKFEGNALDFGMVIPTPARPKLDEMPRDFFKNLAIYTILLPLPQPIYTVFDQQLRMKSMMARGFAPGAAGGMMLDAVKKKTITVLESGVVGSLDYKIIRAEDANDLFNWLKDNKYSYSGDQDTLNFYVKKKWLFTVMKIDSKQMKKNSDGSYLGEVTPTRFTFASDKCIYPLKITQISVKDKTDALFYVQAPNQMDMDGDWSWMHSYRPMYLTYMLGCCIDPDQQKELQARQSWLGSKKGANPNFETTKLEWARKLTSSEIAVLEDPLKNYKQAGVGDLPKGSHVVTLQQFLATCKELYPKQFNTTFDKMPDYAKQQLTSFEDMYQPSKGVIVENNIGEKQGGMRYSSYMTTRFTWYPGRDAPLDDIKELAKLKGQLHEGQWLTKFRKQIRKTEMTDDLVLAAVPAKEEQTYIRIMPTSPP